MDKVVYDALQKLKERRDRDNLRLQLRRYRYTGSDPHNCPYKYDYLELEYNSVNGKPVLTYGKTQLDSCRDFKLGDMVSTESFTDSGGRYHPQVHNLKVESITLHVSKYNWFIRIRARTINTTAKGSDPEGWYEAGAYLFIPQPPANQEQSQ